MKILLVEAGLFHAYRQTDRQKEMTKLIVAFRSFGYTRWFNYDRD